ncbi:calmodulin, putative [Plasmodium berghei]|uniref:Calmodulin n=2 Tax=Plasmodium berghei TaxID=5821 RepID=A0A509ARD7_PLABA|nr:calmodulin, putative [Plasmodium berghei ANKA]CXJ16222.1 calmodulin, putative [Plasmodium berghei]SCM26301.1 calmodulin, putative [Plasmodium berghei]SCN28382.1 calmodulin, putative [Plasmodium berghei]SCO64135.1 calmodulin, putative [Plasmodium berghei]VUC58269.1 calmodulin, putative [Plasmodium berghei ANKA]|eukprot:XP_034424032.1 calmodulin, putative [Plasmodium berghei ANKA]
MEYEGETFHLTEYQINKTIKAFKYLDKKKRGLLKFELLGKLLRCSGYNVSLQEIDKIKMILKDNKIKGSNIGPNEKREDEIIINEDKEMIDNNMTNSQMKGTNENDEINNISNLLSNLKNYDNFMELEKKREEIKRKEEEDKNLFSIKEFFRIIQIPNITNEIKPAGVLNAFEIFDEKGDGKILIKKLRFILQYLGEPLSNSEFDEFFEWLKTKEKVYKTDYIIYDDLLNELISKDTII